MKKIVLGFVTAISILFGTMGTHVLAVPLTIANPSFEEPVLVGFRASTNDTPGWIRSDLTGPASGIFRPDAPGIDYSTPVPDGQQVASIQRGYLSQTLADVLTGNIVYTLQVDIGNNLSLNNGLLPQQWAV